jgi:hypothetical protein
METSMANSTDRRHMLQVEHIKTETAKRFDDVVAALERIIPKLDPAIAEALTHGDERRATELEGSEPLFIFLKRRSRSAP